MASHLDLGVLRLRLQLGYHTLSGFTCVLGLETPALLFALQALELLSHPRSPSFLPSFLSFLIETSHVAQARPGLAT